MSGRVRKVMTQPINLIFRFLQNVRTRVVVLHAAGWPACAGEGYLGAARAQRGGACGGPLHATVRSLWRDSCAPAAMLAPQAACCMLASLVSRRWAAAVPFRPVVLTQLPACRRPQKTRIQIWLYEQTSIRMEGRIIVRVVHVW